ncbi:hypothetical protein ZYGR_0I02740 [Zygosaccharomyces rouxii]
MLVLA